MGIEIGIEIGREGGREEGREREDQSGERARRGEREVLLTIKKLLKVVKHNVLSGNTAPGRTGSNICVCVCECVCEGELGHDRARRGRDTTVTRGLRAARNLTGRCDSSIIAGRWWWWWRRRRVETAVRAHAQA